MYVALSNALYANSTSCGKCIQANGKTLLVVDSCPYDPKNPNMNIPCQQDHLDLSPTAYQAVHGSLNPGSVPNGSLTAKFVPCPVSGNIEYSFTKTTQPYYLAMVVTNAKYGIQKVEYRANGGCAWTAMAARTVADPHWTINGTMVPNPIDLLVTDEYGHVLEDDGVRWTAGQNVPGHAQFPSCP